VAVQLEAITGAGHTWYAPGFGPADGAIDASKVIADFFAAIH
jgi:poly(3-hydroxybutyrate) depolymerase